MADDGAKSEEVEVTGEKQPMYYSWQKLTGLSLKQAIQHGTIDGDPPAGFENYDHQLHGKYDLEAYRDAVLKGYNNYALSWKVCPKVYLQALEHGFDNDKHWTSGGPGVYLEAIQAGFDPEQDTCPTTFLTNLEQRINDYKLALLSVFDPTNNHCPQESLDRISSDLAEHDLK